MVEVLTRQIAFSSTGREWAAVSGEGLHVYSLDDEMIFDPIALTEAITPLAVAKKLQSKQYGLALRMALHLNEATLIEDVMEEIPYSSIALVVRSVGFEHLERLMHAISEVFPNSPHIEFYVQWILELLQTHGFQMEKKRGLYMRAFRSLFKVTNSRYEDLKKLSDENRFALHFLEDHAKMMLEKTDSSKA